MTSAQQVGLVWTDGAYNGGSNVIDYQVLYAIDTPDLVYSVYESGVDLQSIIVTGLSSGTTYSFVVQSRNVIGLSD